MILQLKVTFIQDFEHLQPIKFAHLEHVTHDVTGQFEINKTQNGIQTRKERKKRFSEKGC